MNTGFVRAENQKAVRFPKKSHKPKTPPEINQEGTLGKNKKLRVKSSECITVTIIHPVLLFVKIQSVFFYF